MHYIYIIIYVIIFNLIQLHNYYIYIYNMYYTCSARVVPCTLTYPEKTTFCLERSQFLFSYVEYLLHKMQKHVYKL